MSSSPGQRWPGQPSMLDTSRCGIPTVLWACPWPSIGNRRRSASRVSSGTRSPPPCLHGADGGFALHCRLGRVRLVSDPWPRRSGVHVWCHRLRAEWRADRLVGLARGGSDVLGRVGVRRDAPGGARRPSCPVVRIFGPRCRGRDLRRTAGRVDRDGRCHPPVLRGPGRRATTRPEWSLHCVIQQGSCRRRHRGNGTGSTAFAPWSSVGTRSDSGEERHGDASGTRRRAPDHPGVRRRPRPGRAVVR